MCQKLLRDARLSDLLLRIDEDLAALAKREGCSCGGVLHVADYPRKPRGGLGDGGGKFCRRLSFCCWKEGCRRRRTPPSARFLGRRVYLGVMVVLVTAMCQGLVGHRAERLCAEFEVSRRTLERWRRWWRETFVKSRFWKGERGRFGVPVDEASLPGSLVDRFGGGEVESVGRLMQFLSPVQVS